MQDESFDVCASGCSSARQLKEMQRDLEFVQNALSLFGALAAQATRKIETSLDVGALA